MTEQPKPSTPSVVYVGRVASPGLGAFIFGAAMADVVLRRRRMRTAAFRLLASAIVGLGLGTVRVLAGDVGLIVGFGPWGWPARHIPLAALRSARIERVDPLRQGGWGYRVGAGSTRVVLRGGDALVVDLIDGGSFGITLKDADKARDALQGALARIPDANSR